MKQIWAQNYDPLGSWPLSTAAAALPIMSLFFVLLVLRKDVWKAAAAGAIMSFLLAYFMLDMPAVLIGNTALLGFVFGYLRIAWVIIASVYLYHLSVETGQFEIMKESIAGITSDSRIQLILVAFCFGAFLEGTGGGGAPVAWGGVGNPVRILGVVTGLPEEALNQMIGRILPPFAFILPLWLVLAMVGWKRGKEVWPAAFVAGLSFSAMQFFWSNFGETGLVDIVAAVFSLIVMVTFLKFWKPKEAMEIDADTHRLALEKGHRLGTILKAWSPFMLASLFILLFSLPGTAKFLKFDLLSFPLPGLHEKVLRVAPVAPAPGEAEPAIMNLQIFSLPGTAIFLGALAAAFFLGMSWKDAARVFGKTFRTLIPSMLAISFMVMLAFVTRYSGIDATLGLSLTRTGWIYPFFGTLLGWMGVALTGTDAGSNALLATSRN